MFGNFAVTLIIRNVSSVAILSVFHFLWFKIFIVDCIGQLSEATLYTSPLTWKDAQEHCQSVGQNLIVIDKAYKSTELIPHIPER